MATQTAGEYPELVVSVQRLTHSDYEAILEGPLRAVIFNIRELDSITYELNGSTFGPVYFERKCGNWQTVQEKHCLGAPSEYTHSLCVLALDEVLRLKVSEVIEGHEERGVHGDDEKRSQGDGMVLFKLLRRTFSGDRSE